jgi:hypothetical protein
VLDEGAEDPPQATRTSGTRAKKCRTMDMLRLLAPRHDIGRRIRPTVQSEAPRDKSIFLTPCYVFIATSRTR